MLFPFIATSWRMNVIGTKQPLATVRYLFLTMKHFFFFFFLEYLEEILICFEEELLMLTLRILFSYALWLWFFSICSLQRSFIYDVHKEQREGSSMGHKMSASFANGCAWFLGKSYFLLLWTSTCTTTFFFCDM